MCRNLLGLRLDHLLRLLTLNGHLDYLLGDVNLKVVQRVPNQLEQLNQPDLKLTVDQSDAVLLLLKGVRAS